jgi:Ca-activated chloride channel family protein
MSDELKKLEGAFRKQAEVLPRADAKADAMQRAMQAFEEEKISSASQGMENEARPNQEGNEKKPLFDWKNKMKTLNSNFGYSLMGGASLAVLAFVMVGPNISQFTTLDDQPEVSSVSENVARDAVTAPEVEIAPTVSQDSLVDLGKPNVITKAPAVKSRSLKRMAPSATSGLTLQSESYVSRPLPVPVPSDGVLPQTQNRDKFEEVKSNVVKTVTSEPVSTFSVDVDTASYAFMRSSLNNNQMPNPDSVRIEELINYFDYKYETPTDKSEPFKANVSIMPTPWNEGTKLMSIGIKGYELAKSEQPESNLVFLIDTSGSMNQVNKLPLLRNSFKLLLNSLKPTDTISIVAYAGSAGTVLEPTEVKDKRKILAALDRLSAGGSTAGGEGLRQAYNLAEESLKNGGVNRGILATDGDFNVGISDPEQLKRFVEKKRKTGVTLSVLGFGRGNYNDELMQKLAQNGNGNAAYIDTLSEARKVLVEQAGSTLFTIAKDVKLQVEFNPGLVSEYRLIGYETRALKREDFNNDKVDAGDIGAGHTVTALYEITPVGAKSQNVDPLRYAQAEETKAEPVTNANPDEYGFMKIRYKLPDSDTSTLISTPITLANEVEAVSDDARFAAAVAAFGQLLKGGEYIGDYSYDEIIALALSGKGKDPYGYRAEFINLVRLAQSVDGVQ